MESERKKNEENAPRVGRVVDRSHAAARCEEAERRSGEAEKRNEEMGEGGKRSAREEERERRYKGKGRRGDAGSRGETARATRDAPGRTASRDDSWRARALIFSGPCARWTPFLLRGRW